MTRPSTSGPAMAIALSFLLAFSQSSLAESPDKAPSSLGSVDFPVSCDRAVQEDFNRALALLHHMMYEQARETFQTMTGKAPQCAMGYWGIATSLFHPLWPERPDTGTLQRGWDNSRKALERAPEDSPEAALIEATAAFFRNPEEDDYWTRIDRWAEAMDVAYRRHPGDLDTAAFYGLSRLALAGRADNPDAFHDEAEAVLRQVWEEQPAHPGAIHYSIHATDADGRAENALDMVAVYGDIAPQVPHALHMPSHIYVRLGDWPRVIEWNRRSGEVAAGNKAGDMRSLHYIHAMDYLVYAYLQQNRVDQAREVFREVQAMAPYERSFASAFHMAALPARLAVEQRDWQSAAAITPREPDYLPWEKARWAEGLSWFARGLGAVNLGQEEKAREALNRLNTLTREAREAGEEGFATYLDTDRHILAGWLAWEFGTADKALEQMREAARLEASAEKHPITPGALMPANEALGELLMAMERPREALEAYRLSDNIWPGRYNTLKGALRAAKAAGREDTAKHYREQLERITGNDPSQEISPPA